MFIVILCIYCDFVYLFWLYMFIVISYVYFDFVGL